MCEKLLRPRGRGAPAAPSRGSWRRAARAPARQQAVERGEGERAREREWERGRRWQKERAAPLILTSTRRGQISRRSRADLGQISEEAVPPPRAARRGPSHPPSRRHRRRCRRRRGPPPTSCIHQGQGRSTAEHTLGEEPPPDRRTAAPRAAPRSASAAAAAAAAAAASVCPPVARSRREASGGARGPGTRRRARGAQPVRRRSARTAGSSGTCRRAAWLSASERGRRSSGCSRPCRCRPPLLATRAPPPCRP